MTLTLHQANPAMTSWTTPDTAYRMEAETIRCLSSILLEETLQQLTGLPPEVWQFLFCVHWFDVNQVDIGHVDDLYMPRPLKLEPMHN